MHAQRCMDSVKPSPHLASHGKRLTELMIRYGVGVQNRRTLHIVAVDDDFFE